MRIRLVAGSLFIVLAVSASWAQPLGTAFTYQGRLENAGGPASGLHDLRFRLYDASVGGAQVGTTGCINNVSVTDGLFTVSLDFGAQFTGQQRFLEIEVRADTGLNCANATGFIILTPRQALTAAPNALFALNADRLDGLDSTAFLQSIPVPLTLSGANSTHIIRGENTSTAFTATGVYGEASASLLGYGVYGRSTGISGRGVFGQATAATGTNSGVYGESASTDGRGVFGSALAGTGATQGVWGQSASNAGRGVYGYATAATGTTYGGRFVSDSTAGQGVLGYATAATGTTYGGRFVNNSTTGQGVFREATADSGATYGGRFESASTSGRGVYGLATAAGGVTYGGRFESASNEDGVGVYGAATANSGFTYGVFGESASTAGIGVFGTGRFGVYGQSDGSSGRGVDGLATSGGFSYGGRFQSDGTSGRGVYGLATYAGAGATPYGVLGECSSAGPGYAVYALGDLGASGVKPFRIDHPDDPENKYLLHYAAESPEVINFYSETVTLDERGEAVVELPHYFAKINTRPRYQLTAVGAPMPMLHVAEEISDEALQSGEQMEPGLASPTCSFRIAGGVPGAQASWEVKAVRNDLRMRTHGAPVEVDKVGPERGKYQHPEFYGYPQELGMDYDAEHQRPSSPAPPHRIAK